MQNTNENPNGVPLLVPMGHYYSPIVDPNEIKEREDFIWNWPTGMAGIDLRIEAQKELLSTLRSYIQRASFPDDEKDQFSYFYNNTQYPAVDAQLLYGMLCHFKPKKMIEVGSGFSSLLTAEVNNTILENKIDFTCIEPYPRQFLLDGVPGITSLLQQKVQDVDLSVFEALGAGDILFIDSSHVSKVDSDVNYIYFEVLPRLAKGVIVHIHDIFLPDEYPKKWVFEGWNWNEQYLVRAFLQFNSEYQILWATNFMGTRFGDLLKPVFPRFPEFGGGASLWICRK